MDWGGRQITLEIKNGIKIECTRWQCYEKLHASRLIKLDEMDSYDQKFEWLKLTQEKTL